MHQLKRVHTTSVGAECVLDMCLMKPQFAKWFHINEGLSGRPLAGSHLLTVCINDTNVRVQGLRFQQFLYTVANVLNSTADDRVCWRSVLAHTNAGAEERGRDVLHARGRIALHTGHTIHGRQLADREAGIRSTLHASLRTTAA